MKSICLVALIAAIACSSASEPAQQDTTHTEQPKLLFAHVAASDTSAFQPDAPQDTAHRRVIPVTALIFKIDSVREHQINRLVDTNSVPTRYWHPAGTLAAAKAPWPVAPIADGSSYIAIDTVTAIFEMHYNAQASVYPANGANDWGIMEGASLIGPDAWAFHYNHATLAGDQILVYDRENRPLIAGHRVN